MSKKQLLVVLALGAFFLTNSGHAQSYQTGAGPRFGGLISGLAIKHFVSHTSALEGILSVARKSFIITALYEKQVPVDHSNTFKLYFGAGGHVGFFQDGGGYYYSKGLYTHSSVLGIDGIVGLEYTFKDVPLNIAMDFKPFIDFVNGNTVYFDGGLSLRYTF